MYFIMMSMYTVAALNNYFIIRHFLKLNPFFYIVHVLYEQKKFRDHELKEFIIHVYL